MSVRKIICTIIGVIAAIVVFFLTDGRDIQQRRVLSIATLAVVFWFTEIIPLYVTGLLISFLLIVGAGFVPGEIFPRFFDPVIALFLGGLVLAEVMQKYNIDDMIAYNALKLLGGKPSHVLLGFMAITAFLSMRISNTASAAIMIPLGLKVLKKNIADVTQSSFARSMILGIAYASTIGGIATLVGSPPNPIAIGALTDTGIQFGFLDRMLYALPFVVILLIIIWRVLLRSFGTHVGRFSTQREVSYSFDRPTKVILGVFGVTICGWLVGDYIGLPASVVSLLPIVLLSFFGYFARDDIKNINRPVLILLGSGMVLGYAFIASGLDQTLVTGIQSMISGLPFVLIIGTISIVAILVTMFVSNVASAAILVPLMFPFAQALDISPIILIMVVGMSVSLDFTAPMGNSSNAMAYGTGLFRVPQMAKVGLLISVIAAILLTLFVSLIWRFI